MQNRELVRCLNRLYLVRHLNIQKEVAKYDIHFGQIPIMEYIVANPGCTQIEIANTLQISPASVAISTKRLQKAGFLEKTVDEENLRCKHLYATEKGVDATKKSRCLAKKQAEKMLQGISEEDLEHTLACLKKMLQNIAENPDKETGFFEMIAMEDELLNKRREVTDSD